MSIIKKNKSAKNKHGDCYTTNAISLNKKVAAKFLYSQGFFDYTAMTNLLELGRNQPMPELIELMGDSASLTCRILNFADKNLDTLKTPTKDELKHFFDSNQFLFNFDKIVSNKMASDKNQADIKDFNPDFDLPYINLKEDTMMLNNLIQWTNDKFKDVSELKDYLSFLNISNEYTDADLEQALETHAFCCETAYKTLGILKNYSHIFKFDCSVDVEEIFLRRKILVILLPALEKSIEDMAIPGELILAQIAYIESKLKDYKTHNQNIIVYEFRYFANELEEINFSETLNNYIFGTQDLYPYNNSLINSMILNTKTFVYMKMKDPNSIPNKLKIDIFDNITELPLKGLKKPMQLSELFYYLNQQSAGHAVVFCHNNNKKPTNYINNEYAYYISPIACRYFPTARVKELYLVEHEKTYIFKK